MTKRRTAYNGAVISSLFVLLTGTGFRAAPLDLRPCRIDGVAEELLCSVPENWANPEGCRIKLHIVVFPALSPLGVTPRSSGRVRSSRQLLRKMEPAHGIEPWTC